MPPVMGAVAFIMAETLSDELLVFNVRHRPPLIRNPQ
jgi:hypothetical protein